jgi:hypothetical protein
MRNLIIIFGLIATIGLISMIFGIAINDKIICATGGVLTGSVGLYSIMLWLQYWADNDSGLNAHYVNHMRKR